MVDCATLYARTNAHGKRLANQALTNGIDISEDERATIRLAEPFAALIPAPDTTDVRCSSTSSIVDAGGLKPNTWQRFERLGTAWDQVKLGLVDEPQGAVEDEPGVVANPKRRARTPLTDSQVDAIRTARADGESVVSISRRFGVHRMTVWTHTKDLLS